MNNLSLKNDYYEMINDGRDLCNITLEESQKLKILYFSRLDKDLTLNFDLKENAQLNIDFILMNNNGKLNLNVNLNGAFSRTNIRNLSLVKDGNKEFNAAIYHNAIATDSEVANSSISFDNGHNVFNITGKILKDMKDANARQLTRGLILGENASCKALPILLIDYYDVKAYHGASIGKINDDDLFYLMSRGLSRKEAFILIVNSLLEPFLKEIKSEDLKVMINDQYLNYFEDENNE